MMMPTFKGATVIVIGHSAVIVAGKSFIGNVGACKQTRFLMKARLQLRSTLPCTGFTPVAGARVIHPGCDCDCDWGEGGNE